MTTAIAAPPFPVSLVFPDVDPAILAREEDDAWDFDAPEDGLWGAYLRRLLLPTASEACYFATPYSAARYSAAWA